jgi:RNA polymerase sigma-70 factor (ECF subfamily)
MFTVSATRWATEIETPHPARSPVALDVDQLYRTYGPMVLRRCRRLLRDDGQALDAMQDVFVQVVRHQGRLDATAPSSLLFRLATNVCLNRLRTSKRKPEDADDELVLSIAHGLDEAARAQAASMLRRLFRDEPESSATIAVLHLLDGMTHEEVAAEVGLSVSGVRKRLRTLGHRLEALTEGDAS